MRWTRIILGTVGAMLALAPAAQAADFTVTGTADTSGTCNGGQCTSIRAALDAAEQLAGGDRIFLAAATYTLSGSALTLNSPVLLQGQSARDTKIVAAPGKRVLEIAAASTISHLTTSGGDAAGGFGGNIFAGNTTTTLDHVRVTGGAASAGAGIANLFGTMTIESSLIDANVTVATGAGDLLDSAGGAIVNFSGALNPAAALTLRNSTVALNQANRAGAIISTGSAQNSLTLNSVTVAYNTAGAGGTGGIYNDGGAFAAGSSVVANNTSTGGVSSDCGGAPGAASQGWNVESGAVCGFLQDPDVRNAGTAGLADILVNAGGETDVLVPNVDSPAVNLKPQGCEASDQRSVERPKGPNCDAGAVELEYPVRIDAGPRGTISSSNVAFSFSSSQSAVDFKCGFSGPSAPTPTYTQCTSPASYDNLADASHTFHVKAFKNDVEIGETSRTFTINTTGPGQVTITSGPSGRTNQTTATFAFTSSGGGDYECRLSTPSDTDPAPTACTSPKTYSSLVDGNYSFTVMPAGGDPQLGDSRAFTVDTVKPGAPKVDEPVNNGIVGAHDIIAAGQAENFSTITISEGTAQLAAAVTDDSGQWQTDLDGLAEGRHDFVFVATDQAGNASDPRTVTTTVDTTDPVVTITKIPPSLTNEFTFDVEFSSEPGATFECRHFWPGTPDPDVGPCTSPWSFRELPDGVHRFELTATDTAGNRGPTVSREVTIDSAVPTPVQPVVDGTTFTFAAAEPGATFECRVEGPAGDSGFAPCQSPKAYSGLPGGDYRFTLRTLDAAGNYADADPRAFSVAQTPQINPTPTATATATATPRPTSTPTPTPEIGETVVVQPVSGKILVRAPGSSVFVALDATKGLPVGTEIDARNGKIRLTSEPGQGKPVQKADFYGGIFTVTQGSDGFVELRLTEALAACPKKKKASAAAAKPKTRRLWGDGKGKFRTRGQYSAATIRGTRWLVEDSCQGTLTRVTNGVVSVRDNTTKKTILLRAGKRYLAKPKR